MYSLQYIQFCDIRAKKLKWCPKVVIGGQFVSKCRLTKLVLK